MLPAPAFADLGAAEKGISPSLPGKGIFKYYFENEFEAYCEEWKNKCTVKFTPNKMTVDSSLGITPEKIERAWKLGSGSRSTVWLTYRRQDGVQRLAVFQFHVGSFTFWHRLNLFMSGIQVTADGYSYN